jgi:hypothetical protein
MTVGLNSQWSENEYFGFWEANWIIRYSKLQKK